MREVNKLLKMHRNMADMMKAMGSGKRGPMAGLAQAMGFGGGYAVARADEGELAEESAGRRAWRRARPPGAAKGFARGLSFRAYRTSLSPASAASRLCQAWASGGFPGLGKKK